MGRISKGVSVEGPVTAGAVAWKVGARVRATVVVKACFEFGPSGQCELVRPLPIFVKDRVAASGELNAPSDIAPFVPTPEVIVIGRALHRHGAARVGFRVERGGETIVEKHADVAANAVIGAFAPRRSVWPVAPEAFEAGIVALPSLDGAAFQRCADDQRATELRGNEDVVLIGLYPNAPLLRFTLFAPAVEAIAQAGGHSDAVPLRIDTILVTLADKKCTLLWRGSVPLRTEQALASLTVDVVARPDPRAGAARVKERPPASERDVAMGTVALPESFGTITLELADDDAGGSGGPRSSLPFPKSHAPPPLAAATASKAATPWGEVKPQSVKPASSAMTTLPIDDEDPVAPAPPAVAPAPPAPPAKDPDAPVWRQDPTPEPPPPPSVAPKVVKKDLNAQLYKRPKLKR